MCQPLGRLYASSKKYNFFLKKFYFQKKIVKKKLNSYLKKKNSLALPVSLYGIVDGCETAVVTLVDVDNTVLALASFEQPIHRLHVAHFR